MLLKWNRWAIEDLSEIEAFISEEKPMAAQKFMERLQHTCGLLESSPKLGRAGRVKGTRELIVSSTRYIIAYRLLDQEIEILRVIHSAMRWPSHF